MIRFLTPLFCSVALWAPAALSETVKPNVLVELFASQNCPACPRAHKTMREIAIEKPEALILTWSVTYWDYLGEPDPMALPEAKTRQADYADSLSLRAPYTPQSIYNGQKECPGTRKGDVRKNIKNLHSETDHDLPMSIENGMLTLGEHPLDAPAVVSQVEYLAAAEHDTGMVNPVTKLKPLGDWDGAETSIALSCTSNCAILIHDAATRQILSFLRVS